MGFALASINSDETLSDSLNLVDSSQGNLNLTLPYAGNATGRMVTVKKTSSNNQVWIQGGGNNIDGETPCSSARAQKAH